MRLSFVGSLVECKEEWTVNTVKKFAEYSNEVSVEFHQEHPWLKMLGAQSRTKKNLENKLKKSFDINFSTHTPWDPKKSYRIMDTNFNDRDILKWLSFCANNNIEFVNMHIESGGGIKKSEWKCTGGERNTYLETSAENLKNIISFVETNNIKLSLEILASCLFEEKFGEERVHSPAFPIDYLKLQKLAGFKFGINPDISHIGITWHNLQNNISLGIYDNDDEWKNLSLDKFMAKFVGMCRPMHQIHVADFAGYRNPSEHAITIGTGLLTDNTLRTIIENIDKKAILVLEIREDWKTQDAISKSGYLPRTVESLERFAPLL